MKLWEKEVSVNKKVESFTVGKDREFDLMLAEFDVMGSLAHSEMLARCGLMSLDEKNSVHAELKNILEIIRKGEFVIDENCEDVHSQVEFMLTQKCGDAGKKIHTARSRNDQSLVDIKLFIRSEWQKTVRQVEQLFILLQQLSEKHKDILLPGYTHLQLAMPSSFGLWFGAYAESLSDDLELVLAAYKMANKNPLGSAAGYGSSFPINRELTTELLGFSAMNVNSIYAQMTRGKTEKTAAVAIAGLAATLSKLAMDCTLFMNQNFSFITFPENLTTGSSIMPHKKNPDVLEMIRGKCNRLQSLPNEFSLLLNNLPSGYHRELQLTKEILFPAFGEINACMEMAMLMLQHISVSKNILENPKYDFLFTVDAVNEQVKKGIPFRDAYKNIGIAVDAGIFQKPESITHSHIGSIGNLGNELIKEMFEKKILEFDFEKVEKALEKFILE
jgi:argininosuccinate lyase